MGRHLLPYETRRWKNLSQWVWAVRALDSSFRPPGKRKSWKRAHKRYKYRKRRMENFLVEILPCALPVTGF